MLIARKTDINAHQGSMISAVYYLYYVDFAGNKTAIDLNGKTVKGQIRPEYDSTTAYDFEVTITDETMGQITVYMPANVTATIPRGPLVYDIEVQDNLNPGIRFKPQWGNVFMKPEATRI